MYTIAVVYVFFFLFLQRNMLILSEHEPVQTFSIDYRIINGFPVSAGELPYQLQIRLLNNAHLCGASLILLPTSGEQVALTAAHCVTSKNTTVVTPPEDLLIVGGTTAVNESGQALSTRRILVHPEYEPLSRNGSRNDIAIIWFNGQFQLNRFLQPIALPGNWTETTGMVLVSGWGATNSSDLSHPAPILLKVELPIISTTTCNDWYTDDDGNTAIYDTNLCAGYEFGPEGSCAGDSGGPLAAFAQGQRYLAGVVSWGNESMIFLHF